MTTAKKHHSQSEWVCVYMCLLVCICKFVCVRGRPSDPWKRVKKRFSLTYFKENTFETQLNIMDGFGLVSAKL